MRKIAILAYNHVALFELGCAVELFALPRPEIENWYSAEVVSFDAGPYQSTGGLTLNARQINSLQDYDVLVIPSWPTQITRVKGLLADEIKLFHHHGKRILSFCSGAFLLGALGILDGRQATTHWRYADTFKKRFPACHYLDDVLYVYDGQLGCSAGSAAGIDLALEVIRIDFGQQIANRVARRMVVSAHRKGGQSQYVESPILPTNSQFTQAIDWAITNLHNPFTIDIMAGKADMSRRTFDRKFRSTFKLTPKDWLTSQRLQVAKQLLEQKDDNIELVASQAGFDNAATMRHHFRRNLGLSPRQYRDQFSRA
ncbi:MAG: helix-turn-helix domain-containing protein [Gammaproteobacteria bacterium]|nr:helix-turn-helix domain-containing protein [Gammaproteobacteria bacterium]